MRAQPSSAPFPPTLPPAEVSHSPLFRTLTTQRITNTLGKFLPIAASREPGKPVLSRSCLHYGVKQNYVDFLPNLPVESLDCSQLTSHAALLCFQNLGHNSCFPPSQSRDCIVETPLNALLASWQNLSSDLERPLHKQIPDSNCTSYSEKGLVAQTHIFLTP